MKKKQDLNLERSKFYLGCIISSSCICLGRPRGIYEFYDVSLAIISIICCNFLDHILWWLCNSNDKIPETIMV